MDVAAMVKQLERVYFRQLFFCRFLRGARRLGLQFREITPCRSQASPIIYDYTIQKVYSSTIDTFLTYSFGFLFLALCL